MRRTPMEGRWLRNRRAYARSPQATKTVRPSDFWLRQGDSVIEELLRSESSKRPCDHGNASLHSLPDTHDENRSPLAG